MEIINSFINQYKREFDFYEKSSSLCAKLCESLLQRNGIRAIVTFRAKDPERLREKLIKRHEEYKKLNIKDKYNSNDDIYNDIVDFAGVRIALYFPGDRYEVSKIIKSSFNSVQEIIFPKQTPAPDTDPYKKTFGGYLATHYRVNLKEESESPEFTLYSQARIEIQVASLLMHAWSEVEHDLAYKPLTGTLSENEYAILNELNGLVLVGESNLERLQKAIKDRVETSGYSFTNHYELASFIFDNLKSTLMTGTSEFFMGRADILFRFLQLAELNSPEIIKQYVMAVDISVNQKAVVEQIIDNLLLNKPDLYDVYKRAYVECLSRNPYSHQEESAEKSSAKAETNDSSPSYESALGYFISKWIIFENISRILSQLESPTNFKHSILSPKAPLKYLTGYKNEIQWISNLRNQVVHGMDYPSTSVLLNATKSLENIVNELNAVLPANLRDKIVYQLNSTSNRNVALDFVDAVIDALILPETGIFLAHHFERLKEHPLFEARGEGPKFTYLISIKYTTNIQIILDQLKRQKSSLNNCTRFLLIIPSFSSMPKIDDPHIKIALFDAETNTFANRNEIYEWIYSQSE